MLFDVCVRIPIIPSSRPGLHVLPLSEPVIAVPCYQSFPGMVSSGGEISLHGQ